MPKRVAPEERRVALNCLIRPATRNAITQVVGETGESQGEVVDRAVLLLAFGEEVNAVTLKDAGRIELKALEPRSTVHVVGLGSLPDWRAGRKPLTKPKDRK